MPYITATQRVEIDHLGVDPTSPGELNYAITKVISNYLQNKHCIYTTINDIIGALEGAKMEFYRRVVVPYEDKKLRLHGDVYPSND